MRFWQAYKLGDVADIGSGGTPPKSDPDNFGIGIPWLSVKDLNDGTVDETRASLTQQGLANSSAKLRPAGTIFMAIYASIGKLGITSIPACSSQAIAFFDPNPDLIDKNFLFHFLKSQRSAFQRAGRGVTQNNIGLGDLRSWEIFLPDLPEQRRIAAILDQSAALVILRSNTLKQLDFLRESMFQSIYMPLGIEATTTIGAVLESTQYGSAQKASDIGEVPILRMGNITDQGRIDEHDLKYLPDLSSVNEAYLVNPGDLLFNRTNSLEKVGKGAVVTSTKVLAFAGYLVRARFDSFAKAHWVSAFLRSPQGVATRRRTAKAAVNQANINATEFKKFQLRVPEDHVMEKFMADLQTVESLIEQHQQELIALRDLFASLQARAFRGEL